MIIKHKGQLEVDTDRGVVYFHSNKTGTTVMRICGLKFPPSFGYGNTDSFDISTKKDTPTMYNVTRPHG